VADESPRRCLAATLRTSVCAHRKMHAGPAHRLVTPAVGDESETTPP
jgi:hypothetical protein